MKNKVLKVLFVLLLMLIALEIKSYATKPAFYLVASEDIAKPNSEIKITITGNNLKGELELKGTNIKLSEEKISLESSEETTYIKEISGRITGKSGEKAEITATPKTLESGSNPEEKITESKSITIEIKEKEVEVPVPVATPEPTTPATTSNPEPAKPTETKPAETKTETPKPANNTSKTTPKKTEPTQPAPEPEKPAQEIIPAEEDQGTPSEFGITEMRIYGVMPEGAKVELEYTPQFDLNQPVYSCKLTKEMVNINVEIQANEYKDLVKVESPDEIKEGENIIRISMDDGNGRSKQYVIRAIKEESEKTEDDLLNEQNEENTEELENVKPVRKKSQYMLINVRDFLWVILWIVIFENSLIALIYLLVKRIKNNKSGFKKEKKSKNKDKFNYGDSGNLF
ncbi:MAG: hypothetical protein IJ223_05405 [Clostridia bacterium]|nr:hypothetical protein [Clostridia bacterium]